MTSDLRTLLWLQIRLLRNALRRGSVQDTGRLIGVIALAVLALPSIIAMAVGMAIGLRFADLTLTGTIVAIVFSFILLMWLATPASNQQLTEPLDLPKLFHLPIGFRSLALGSLALNSVSLAALMTGIFLIATLVGAARSFGHVLAMGISSLLFLGLLIVLKALIDDILDLAAEDRRLRLIFILISLLPVLLIVYGQLAFQTRFINSNTPDDPLKVLRSIDLLSWLRWLPSGWYASSLLGVRTGAWSDWLIWSLALLLCIGFGLILHLRLMRQLYFGDFFRMAVRQRQATSALRPSRRLPFLSAAASNDLLALLRKDWLNFIRSPMTARLFFLPILLAILAYFFSLPEMPVWAMGLGIAGFTAFMVTMMAHNQICTYDHIGVGALALSPVPRHLMLMSYALINLAVTIPLAAVAGLASFVRQGDATVIAIAIAVAFIAQMAFNGLTHLTSLVFPYYMDLERGQAGMNEAKASFFTVFSTLFGSPLLGAPIFVPLALAWSLFPAYLPAAFAFAVIYAILIYLALLFLAARIFPRREERLVETMLARR